MSRGAAAYAERYPGLLDQVSKWLGALAPIHADAIAGVSQVMTSPPQPDVLGSVLWIM